MGYKVEINAAPKQLQEMMQDVIDKNIDTAKELKPIAPGVLPTLDDEQDCKMYLAGPGTWTHPTMSPSLVLTATEKAMVWWDKEAETWSSFEKQNLKGDEGANGANGKTTEVFNPTKSGGYAVGDSIYFPPTGEKKSSYLVVTAAAMGENPTTHPAKFEAVGSDIELDIPGGAVSYESFVNNEIQLPDVTIPKSSFTVQPSAILADGTFGNNGGMRRIEKVFIYEGATIDIYCNTYATLNAYALYDVNDHFVEAFVGQANNPDATWHRTLVMPFDGYLVVSKVVSQWDTTRVVISNQTMKIYQPYGTIETAPEVLEDLQNLFNNSVPLPDVNILKADFIKDIGRITAGGNIVDADYFVATDYIPVLAGSIITSESNINPTYYGLAIYDKNKSPIQVFEGNSTDWGAYGAPIIVTMPQDGFVVQSMFTSAWNGGVGRIKISNINQKIYQPYAGDDAEQYSGFHDVGDKYDFAKPQTLIKVNLMLEGTIPGIKDVYVNGTAIVEIDGIKFKKFCTIDVQGASSVNFAKKNLTIAFFNDEARASEFEFRLNNSIYLSEWVYKANWIDATHVRNIGCNRFWEAIVQTRNTFPVREVETPYQTASESDTFDTGATGHVDGYPCAIYLGTELYGIGSFNMGKKRANYNLKKANKSQVQLNAVTEGRFDTFLAVNWELRNPDVDGYEEAGPITDPDVMAVINRQWAFHNVDNVTFKANFDQHFNKVNIIDYYLFINYLMLPDDVTKNLQYTTWDGLVWFVLPYDLDQAFGLNWTGDGLPWSATLPIFTTAIWGKILANFRPEIEARYKELRDIGVFTPKKVYDICKELELIYGQEMYEAEQERWPTIPSKSITSIKQITDFMVSRTTFLDSEFNYI